MREALGRERVRNRDHASPRTECGRHTSLQMHRPIVHIARCLVRESLDVAEPQARDYHFDVVRYPSLGLLLTVAIGARAKKCALMGAQHVERVSDRLDLKVGTSRRHRRVHVGDHALSENREITEPADGTRWLRTPADSSHRA